MNRFEKELGHTFQNTTLLKAALTHPSALPPGHGVMFERLEFLGDRVLGLVISTWIFESFPNEPEGSLAKRFTALVCKQALVKVAKNLSLEFAMRIKKERSSSQEKRLETLLADGCEALIGALYLDGGLKTAEAFIRQQWKDFLQITLEPPQDSKSILQEWAQGLGKPHPTYNTVSSTGPSHSPSFLVEVCVEGFESVRGEGTSKRLAEKDAAQHMLDKIQRDD